MLAAVHMPQSDCTTDADSRLSSSRWKVPQKIGVLKAFFFNYDEVLDLAHVPHNHP